MVDTQPIYWFFRPESYRALLPRYEIEEADYLSAMKELASLYTPEQCRNLYEATLREQQGLDHFSLFPHPFQRLKYHPLPLLLHFPANHEELIYLGLAIRDYRRQYGNTKTFTNILASDHYRGALFEFEVGATLARTKLNPTYRKDSPDFLIPSLPLGVEATIREVPLPRAVVNQLTLSVGFVEFRRLNVEITATGEFNPYDLANKIAEDAQRMLSADETESVTKDWRLSHDKQHVGDQVLVMSYGKYRYENTLAYLIKKELTEKENRCSARLDTPIPCVAALDVRSLFGWPEEPRNDYERALVARNKPYFDRVRQSREQVIAACQTYAANSSVIKGVLLWDLKRTFTPADKVHRRCSIRLVTASRDVEATLETLAAELNAITRRA
jgi:hypothetical protein